MHLVGHYYHVYNRGCNRENIFANAGNYVFLLRRARSFLADYPLSVIAHCLMPNHYHFLLRPEEGDALSRFIQRLFNSYTQAFNKQQGRSGTLFEGRAKSVLVDTDEYALYLCRYVHLNPVKAGLVAHPGEWPYSNPPGPDSGDHKVARGGGWFNTWLRVRAAYRAADTPDYRDHFFGFRCAGVAPGP